MSRLVARAQRSIRTEILIAQFLVVAAASLTVIVSTLVLAPYFSDSALRHLRDAEGAAALDATIHADTQTAIEEIMFSSTSLAVAIACLAAAAVSFFVARHIVEPIRELVGYGERMAEGNYAVRVPITSENEVGDLARSFNALAAALERTEERRLQLLGDVTHELRTPLATLHANLEGLLEGIIEPDPELWVSLMRETQRLRRLVEDLQELSRAQAGQLQLEIAYVDPGLLITRTVQRLQPSFDTREVTLRVDLPTDLPEIQVDANRTVQVLVNVLGNARRYTSAGGEVTLSARAHNAGAGVTIEIADTGMGIAPDDLPHVFERFYRAESSRAHSVGGTGIGLTIARSLMEQQRGTIIVASPGPGQGTTVTLTFPSLGS